MNRRTRNQIANKQSQSDAQKMLALQINWAAALITYDHF